MTINSINAKTERIKSYAAHTLSSKFRMPVEIDDSVARLIACSVLRQGGENVVWLNGEKVSLQNARLKLILELPQNNDKD